MTAFAFSHANAEHWRPFLSAAPSLQAARANESAARGRHDSPAFSSLPPRAACSPTLRPRRRRITSFLATRFEGGASISLKADVEYFHFFFHGMASGQPFEGRRHRLPFSRARKHKPSRQSSPRKTRCHHTLAGRHHRRIAAHMSAAIHERNNTLPMMPPGWAMPAL